MSPQVRPYTFKEHVDSDDSPEIVGPPVPPKDEKQRGMKRRTWLILFGCGLFWILALALGLGLGLGLGLHKSKNPYDCNYILLNESKLTVPQQWSPRRCILSAKSRVLYWWVS
jgi:hypothetical protein